MTFFSKFPRFYVKNIEFFNRFDGRISFFNQPVHFAMATDTKSAQVINKVIFLISIYMVNIQSFFRLIANSAIFWKRSISDCDVTPWLISNAIEKMIFSFQKVLTFSRTKSCLFFSMWKAKKSFFTNLASFFNSRLFSTASTAISRSFNSVVTRIVTIPAAFTSFYNFRSQCHREQLYAY